MRLAVFRLSPSTFGSWGDTPGAREGGEAAELTGRCSSAPPTPGLRQSFPGARGPTAPRPHGPAAGRPCPGRWRARGSAGFTRAADSRHRGLGQKSGAAPDPHLPGPAPSPQPSGPGPGGTCAPLPRGQARARPSGDSVGEAAWALAGEVPGTRPFWGAHLPQPLGPSGVGRGETVGHGAEQGDGRMCCAKPRAPGPTCHARRAAPQQASAVPLFLFLSF